MNPESYPQYWVNHLSFLLRRDLAARFAMAGHDVSAEEWAVLLVLQDAPGLTPGEMSARTLRDKTTVTRMVDRLERKGFVIRSRDERDRRVVRLQLSDAGAGAFAQLAEIARGLIVQGLEGIAPEDLDTTLTVLRRMAANMKQEESDDEL